METEKSFRAAVRCLIANAGDDPDRDGLKDTPNRMWKAFDELYSGYDTKPETLFRVFDEPTDQMVVVRDLEFWSMCEHHMLPFFGKAHIGYLPNHGKVIGVSKLGRVLEMFARRLQVQERLCREITECLMEHLKPDGCGCIIEAKHLCMICRGVQKQQSVMTTTSLKGNFLQPDVKSEFVSHAYRGGV